MVVYYESITGNIERFLRKAEVDATRIRDTQQVDETFVLVTNTIGFGRPPGNVSRFLEDYGHLLRGVAASGNRNWGAAYARAADDIAEKYDVPILLKFELSGTSEDVRTFTERVRWIGDNNESYRA